MFSIERRIQLFCFLSGTIEDTELVDGLVLDQKTIGFGAPTRVEKAKIALIQFCISPPKTDVLINDRVQQDFHWVFFISFRWKIQLLLVITHKWIVLSKKNVNTY